MCTVVLLTIGSKVAKYLGLFDVPNGRLKQHAMATPLVGGLAIFGSLFIGLLIIDRPPKLDILLICLSLIVITGALDDKFNLPIRLRIATQILCSLIMVVAGGVMIEDVGPLVGSNILLPKGLAILLTIIVSIVLMNAVNMSDGVDGNAAGHVLVALFLISFSQWLYVDEIRRPEWLSALTVSVTIFWVTNLSITPIRKVFMGDAGSIPLGFILAWLCIDFSQGPGRSLHPVMALWTLLIPIYDAIGVVGLRIHFGRSPLRGDRMHFHHLLPSLFKIDPRLVVIAMLVLNLLVGSVGIWLTKYSPVVGLLAYLTLMCAVVTVHFLLGRQAENKGYLHGE